MHAATLDLIVWGNPSQEDKGNMDIHNYLSDLTRELCQHPFPRNSSDAVKKELRELTRYAHLMEHSPRRTIFDEELLPCIKDLFEKNGVDPDEVWTRMLSIVTDVMPLVTRLKYAYQRPRPAQLAYYLDVKLFPCFSKYISSPSYPSTHTILVNVIAEVLISDYATGFPDCYQVMQRFCGEVMESRLYMGVHYPSDNAFGLKVTQAIVNNTDFREKYGL